MGAREELLERDSEKQAFPAEVDNLYDDDAVSSSVRTDWQDAKMPSEDSGGCWLVLKPAAWKTAKFDPRSLEEAVQAELTGECLCIGEDDRGGEMELADN